jgi:hypothetical protein
MVILAVESTGKAFASGDLINRAFYHCTTRPGERHGKNSVAELLKKLLNFANWP